jgi:dipeptidyl aminopeptidase/acylaminoacyl peptidase
VALLLLGGGGVAAAQPTSTPGPRAITHEDVFLMKRLGAPVVSPDGAWAVVSVTTPGYDEKDQSSDLWLVPTAGTGTPRPLTATRTGESGAAWSPDGRRLAFSARRDGDEAAQVYVLEMSGGEAQRVTSLTAGARSPHWSPDGRTLLFVSDVYPGARDEAANKAAAADRKARKWNARVYDGFPVRNWDRWLDDRRPSLFVQAADAGATARDLLAGSALVGGPGFGGSLGAGTEDLAAVWTPDGAGVVFAATTNRDAAAHAEAVTSLWLAPVAGGEPTRLTPDQASYGAPAFSRDGRRLFATMEPAGDRIYRASRLVSFGWPDTGRPVVVTAGFDGSVRGFRASPDGRTVYFTAEDAGLERLYAVAAAGGAALEVGRLDRGTLSGLSVGGTTAPVIVALGQSATEPPEVVRLDPATGARTPLTRLNVERAARLDLAPVEHFWFTSRRGARIHSMIVRPPGFDPGRKYPLFAVIHGGPHSMWRDEFVIRWNYHLLAAPGYVVLLTNYTGSTGFGEPFAQAIQGDPLEGPGLEINEAVDEAIRRYPFVDGTRLAAGGASYGGHLANWLAVTTTRFRCLVSHAGLFDLKSQWATSDVIYGRERTMGGPAWEGGAGWRDQSPFYRAPNLGTPILVTVGERDFRVPLNNALEFWSVLQRLRVPSRLIVFPDENHWILKGENSRFFYEEVHRWLARHLGAGAAGPPSGGAAAADPGPAPGPGGLGPGW